MISTPISYKPLSSCHQAGVALYFWVRSSEDTATSSFMALLSDEPNLMGDIVPQSRLIQIVSAVLFGCDFECDFHQALVRNELIRYAYNDGKIYLMMSIE